MKQQLFPGMHSKRSSKTLFPPWTPESWRRVDDSVRGGASKSYLEYWNGSENDAVVFKGLLDTTVLGGAGFASQKLEFSSPLNLCGNPHKTGLKLSIHPQDLPNDAPSHFVITLKTQPPPPPSQPKPRSQLTYESMFVAPAAQKSGRLTTIVLPFDSFTPTFRGRTVPKEDPRWKPLDLSRVYELGFMCRSEFGKQQGEFQLVIAKIEVVTTGKRASSFMAAIGRFEAKLWTALACTSLGKT